MTDNEIIKALEYCSDEGRKNCKNCPIYKVTNCFGTLSGETVDLINRQQAEIEKLNKEIQIGKDAYTMIQTKIAIIKSEAIKEFEERLKYKYKNYVVISMDKINNEIDNLVKEYEKGR